MKKLIFITHANVEIDSTIPVPEWGLSKLGSQRHATFNSNKVVEKISSIYCSEEQKAIDGAEILGKHLKLKPKIRTQLHENDRSSTGFLPPEEFQKVANEFFANPTISIRGWETATDAQNRIVSSILEIIDEDKTHGDIAIVAHGGVGTLLLSYFLGIPISRENDQPMNGGGNYFIIDIKNKTIVNSWIPIDEH